MEEGEGGRDWAQCGECDGGVVVQGCCAFSAFSSPFLTD